MKRLFNLVSVAALSAAVFSAGTASAGRDDGAPGASGQTPNIYNNYLQPVATAIDYHTRMLYLFNYENDKLITVDPQSIPGWPGNIPLQHTVVIPEGNRIYITSDNTAEHASYIIALNVNHIDWHSGVVSLTV